MVQIPREAEPPLDSADRSGVNTVHNNALREEILAQEKQEPSRCVEKLEPFWSEPEPAEQKADSLLGHLRCPCLALVSGINGSLAFVRVLVNTVFLDHV